MVKVFALLPRRPDITDEFFHEHWSTTHADLALKITTIKRYVQAHRIGPGVSGLPDSICEGIAEVWFDSLEDAAGMGEDPNYTQYAELDNPNFIDVDRLAFVLCDEQVERSGPVIGKDDPAGAKAMLLLKRADGLSPETFAGQLPAVVISDVVPAATRVTVSTALPENYADGAEAAFDAVVELWFEDTAAFAGAWRDGENVLAALDGIADRERSAGFLAEELRVRWPEPARA